VGCDETSRFITSSLNDFFVLNAWVHVVATINGNTMSMYNNGVLAVTGMRADTPTTMTRLYHYLGKSCWSADGYFEGTIGYFRVWNGYALNAFEARAVFLQRFACPSSVANSRAGTAGACALCAAGQYLPALGYASCVFCPSGTYSSTPGALGMSSCTTCASGKFSGDGSSVCVAAPTHEWDFRGCTTGATVTDTYSTLLATPSATGTTCSSYGMAFSGSSSFVTLQSWNWGGSTSFEVFAKYSSFNSYASLFDFGNGQTDNNVVLGVYTTVSTAYASGESFVCTLFL
jgi:hypothetical protein